MSLPFMKLGTLAVRTLSKPIATRLKKQAAVSPKFRTSIIGIAQANHWLTTTIQRRIYGRATNVEVRPLNEESATNVEVRPLNEERAVQAAGDLIGELFVFTVAGAVVIFEVQRSARSEAKKEGIRKKEIEVLMQRDEDLTKQVQLLEQKLSQLEQITKEKALTCVVNLENNQTKDVKTAISSS